MRIVVVDGFRRSRAADAEAKIRNRSRPSPTCAQAGSRRARAAPRAPRRSSAQARSRALPDRSLCVETSCTRRVARSRAWRSPRLRGRQAARPRRSKRAKTRLGRDRHTRIDQHRRQRRQRQRRRQDLADAAHQPRARIEADRHVSAGRARGREERADRRARGRWRVASSRNAAAASAEPPPRPAATGSALSRRNAPSARPATRAASARAALSTRLSSGSPACRGGRPAHRQRKLAAAREAQPVAEVGEHHQAFDFMIAVGAPAEHAQRQIDLGGRVLDQRDGQGRASPAVAGLLRLGGIGRRGRVIGQPGP